MTLLRAIVGVLIAPAEPEPALAVAPAGDVPPAVAPVAVPAPVEAPPTEAPLAVGVVASCEDAAVIGGAVAMALARARRQPTALVAVWTGAASSVSVLPVPARPATRRLAARLVAAGHAARACGRVVIVSLPTEEALAAAAVRSLEPLAAAPAVLVIGGPRGASLDRLLGERDRVLVVTPPGTDPAVAPLVAGELPLAPSAVAACAVAPGTGARLLARAGLWRTPSLRAALRMPLEEWA